MIVYICEMPFRYAFLISVFLFCCAGAYAQQADLKGPKLLYLKQQSKSLFITSRGWGVNYRRGKHITGKSDGVLEFDFTTFRHPKEVKVRSDNGNNRSYYLGKLNSLAALRVGYGVQKSLFGKEVENAIEIKWNIYAGASIGLAKPVYLEIRKQGFLPGEVITVDERYNPETHSPSNISGRAPFYKGLTELAFHPGAYAKASLSFDFADEDDRMKFLEAGVCADFFLPPVKMMAYNPANSFFFSLFVAYNIGSKELN